MTVGEEGLLHNPLLVSWVTTSCAKGGRGKRGLEFRLWEVGLQWCEVIDECEGGVILGFGEGVGVEG